VYVQIYHNNSYKGSAWSGRDVYQNRNTGTYTVVLSLNPGDSVHTFADSGSGHYRHLAEYHVKGYLVKTM
jgi:hypothetical protein